MSERAILWLLGLALALLPACVSVSHLPEYAPVVGRDCRLDCDYQLYEDSAWPVHGYVLYARMLPAIGTTPKFVAKAARLAILDTHIPGASVIPLP